MERSGCAGKSGEAVTKTTMNPRNKALPIIDRIELSHTLISARSDL
jgi:hypothetical protein